MATARLTQSDKPVPGVRLYLTSGQSVITDSEGLYSFPALNDGSQVDCARSRDAGAWIRSGRWWPAFWPELDQVAAHTNRRRCDAQTELCAGCAKPDSSSPSGRSGTKPVTLSRQRAESKTATPEEEKRSVNESIAAAPRPLPQAPATNSLLTYCRRYLRIRLHRNNRRRWPRER